MQIDKLNRVRVMPIEQVHKVTHKAEMPDEIEIVEKSLDLPSKYPTRIIEEFYSMKGKLVNASSILINAYV